MPWGSTPTLAPQICGSLPASQVAFPTGGLYFKNQTWVQETKGLHVIIHNNYITGFEKKIKRFRDFGLWLVDDYALESPLGRI
ncbi:UDP-D-xylose:L-fucose alpha-1,3-D-xylosyltransferase MGP4 [Vitis vinifera]|uniref:UDP-D-xylose:L-fucose alpha-1,3-D-xylosyltransferase MGP4 n=1 Tax=Vitis vinifera TaxID=29760 RepID=A0A438IM09_VITVI|nr:UDP-D-xylose:L-fucose alpha-1,3-D-xylosyltransferase MGP4 [Vitis vinifera]